LDLFIKRELGCRAYLRYVDDFVLFSDSKRELLQWKKAIGERLASLRLTVHETSAQVTPTNQGIPWLGFVVFPEFRRIKGQKLHHTCRRLSERYDAWRSGSISFGEFDASVQGWINHVRYADSWGLREEILSGFVWGLDDYAKGRGIRS
jgi:RNA-directed DNA polymerase